ncbi:MAG: hypothetical protein AAGA69_00545 [Pseudomonadota bacterium]
MEYLGWVSSFESQREEAETYPGASLLEELFSEWAEWVPISTDEWRFDLPVFSPDELSAMVTYHEALLAYRRLGPNPSLPLEDLQMTYEWVRQTEAAAAALSVFEVRGPFSDERAEIL